MIEPDDFGFTGITALARVPGFTRAGSHAPFWKRWNEAVWANEPDLVPRAPRDADLTDDSADHQFESVRHTRIGCALTLPRDRATPIRAGLVALHGYESPPRLGVSRDSWQALADRGAAVLTIRVRGYAGSSQDTPALNAHVAERGGGEHARGGAAWITHGLCDSEPSGQGGVGADWVLPLAVADVVNACRALRRWMARRPGSPRTLMLHGESFGGGLAVLATSALLQRDPIDRLVIALPSLGDWPWRLDEAQRRCVSGTARHVLELIKARRDREERILEHLRLCDAAVHARRVRCPVLAKLALRDDTVPAPAAAGVFNEIASAPGEKLRVVTRYGHFDGGISDARRHVLFDRLAAEFLDPTRTATEALARCDAMLAARTEANGRGADGDHGATP